MRLTEALLQGPRGRRLLLEYALASDHLDHGRGALARLIGELEATSFNKPAVVTAEAVAQQLASVALAKVTPTLLRDCLFRSVDWARYWQEPDVHDRLAATPEMRESLQRVAEHIAESPHTAWWSEPVAESTQWAVNWEGSPPSARSADPTAVLGAARDREIEEEIRAHRERPKNPAANFSGDWWSRPPWELPSSARTLTDGSPAKLWFVEDSLGWERAEATRLGVPTGLRVYEIDTAEAWARLCERFPLEVTAQKRHDWYRTTGRTGAWVIPDWAKVAEHYDAVHLQALAYLSAAGTAIAVSEHSASVIAGWDPDQTFWFSPDVRYLDAPVTWEFSFENDRVDWQVVR